VNESSCVKDSIDDCDKRPEWHLVVPSDRSILDSFEVMCSRLDRLRRRFVLIDFSSSSHMVEPHEAVAEGESGIKHGEKLDSSKQADVVVTAGYDGSCGKVPTCSDQTRLGMTRYTGNDLRAELIH
jgi:hypothetical protein